MILAVNAVNAVNTVMIIMIPMNYVGVKDVIVAAVLFVYVAVMYKLNK